MKSLLMDSCLLNEKNELWRIAPDKNVKIVPAKYQDKLLNGPNDLWITRNGGVYFTDLFIRGHGGATFPCRRTAREYIISALTTKH